MLGLTQLSGFGAGGAGATGAITATLLDEVSSTTFGSDLISGAFTPTAGTWLLILLALDNAGLNGASSFVQVDYLTGPVYTYTNVIDVTQDPGAANAGVTVACAISATTVTATSMSVVGSFNESLTSKAMQVWQLSLTDATSISVAATASSTGNGTAPTASISAIAGDLLIGCLGIEALTLPTADAGWSTGETTAASTGTAGTSIAMIVQPRTIASDTSYAYEPTFGGTARDYAEAIIALRPTP